MVSLQERVAAAQSENQKVEQEVAAQRVRLAAHTETAQSAHDAAAEAAALAKKAMAEALELAEALKQAEKKKRETAKAERQAQDAKVRAENVERQSAQQLVRLQERADAVKLKLKALLEELDNGQKEYEAQKKTFEAQIAALTEKLQAGAAMKSDLARELKRSLESSSETVEPGPPALRRRTMQSAPGLAAGLHTSTSAAVVSAGSTSVVSTASAGRLEPRQLSVVQAAAVTPPAFNSPAVTIPTDPTSPAHEKLLNSTAQQVAELVADAAEQDDTATSPRFVPAGPLSVRPEFQAVRVKMPIGAKRDLMVRGVRGVAWRNAAYCAAQAAHGCLAVLLPCRWCVECGSRTWRAGPSRSQAYLQSTMSTSASRLHRTTTATGT